MTISIRPFKITDAPDVVAMAKALAAAHGAESKLREEFLRHAIGIPGVNMLVARQSAEAVGYITAVPEIFLRANAMYLRVNELYVAPTARHQEVGTALMAGIAQRVRKNHMTGVSVSFRQTNHEAREFYAKLGFDFAQNDQAKPDNKTSIQAWLIGDKLAALSLKT